MTFSYISYYYKPKLPKRLILKGQLSEKRAKTMLKSKMDIKRGKTKKIYFKNFTLVGRADFISDDCVIEVKSSFNNKFLIPSLAQLNLYMLMEEKDKGLLIMGEKEILVEKSNFVIRQSLAYFEQLAKHILEFKIPEGDTEFCGNCCFTKICFNVNKDQAHL